MKTLKLNQLEKNVLANKELEHIKGGNILCGCACRYENNGGSSSANNDSANDARGLHSPGMKLYYLNTVHADGTVTLGTTPVWRNY